MAAERTLQVGTEIDLLFEALDLAFHLGLVLACQVAQAERIERLVNSSQKSDTARRRKVLPEQGLFEASVLLLKLSERERRRGNFARGLLVTAVETFRLCLPSLRDFGISEPFQSSCRLEVRKCPSRRRRSSIQTDHFPL